MYLAAQSAKNLRKAIDALGEKTVTGTTRFFTTDSSNNQ
jgi:hypothetical protein